MTESVTGLIKNKGACRTAPATQGPVNIYIVFYSVSMC